jgi:hypothetical protein
MIINWKFRTKQYNCNDNTNNDNPSIDKL